MPPGTDIELNANVHTSCPTNRFTDQRQKFPASIHFADDTDGYSDVTSGKSPYGTAPAPGHSSAAAEREH